MKLRLGEFERIALTQECSYMLYNKIPQKLKDPGSFIRSHAKSRSVRNLSPMGGRTRRP